jgi:hypothetical protein
MSQFRGFVDRDQRRGTIKWGDEHSFDLWAGKCRARREVMLQLGREHEVAPMHVVNTPRGVHIPAGSPITAQQLAGGDVPGELMLDRLVEKGVVLRVHLPRTTSPVVA